MGHRRLELFQYGRFLFVGVGTEGWGVVLDGGDEVVAVLGLDGGPVVERFRGSQNRSSMQCDAVGGGIGVVELAYAVVVGSEGDGKFCVENVDVG